jgi:hypothetical protein
MTAGVAYKEVDVAIVSEHYWSNDTCCPHCKNYAAPELIDVIDSRETHLIAEMNLCTDCHGLFFVVEFPYILHPIPIMTRWKIPDTIR